MVDRQGFVADVVEFAGEGAGAVASRLDIRRLGPREHLPLFTEEILYFSAQGLRFRL